MKPVYLAAMVLCLSSAKLCAVEPVHTAAHAGISYMIVEGVRVVCERVFYKNDARARTTREGGLVPCAFAGVGTSAVAGILKESMDGKNDNHSAGFIADGIGIGLGVVTVTFQW